MPAERVSMRRVREILRLKYEGGASERAIARSLGIARSTVALTLEHARQPPSFHGRCRQR
jgi:DNA-binding transcriptional regulator LsrR (DeoR family)